MYNQEPDRTEKAIRFGCGALLGMLVGFSVTLSFVGITWGAFWAVFLGSVFLCDWLAMKYGDRFWESIRNLPPWI